MRLKNLLFIFIIPLHLTYCSQAIPQFDGGNAMQYLKNQCEFGPRVPGSEASKKCLEYLESELTKSAGKVVKQQFQHFDKEKNINLLMTNLLAAFNPNVNQRIFLAAHWDSRPFADRDPNPLNRNKPVPGANDGASGVAVLLEIARNLGENAPEIGVDIILFDGEDYGREGHLEDYFLGSRFFAKSAANYRPRFGILLDMVGDAQLSIPIEGHSQEYLPHLVEKVWSTAESLGFTEFERRMGQYINDDHKMLIDKGIPCIDIIDFNYPDESHRYWHTLEDTPDKCSVESLHAVGTVILNVIYNEQLQ